MKKIYFFIGTEAELIKLFPVMLECRNRNRPFEIIASGQNNIKKSRILKEFKLCVSLELSDEATIKKSKTGLFSWFLCTWVKAGHRIRSRFGRENLKNAMMVVHGDTVSTLMGAMVGKKLGMKVCHVEAGLRSHHLLNPFPEEIDRILTSRCADVHFAPGKEKCANLKKVKGNVIDTKYNTILDSLEYSKQIPFVNGEIGTDGKYFIFVLHRQENLANKKFVEEVLEKMIRLSKKMSCKFILHAPTKIALDGFGLLAKCEQADGIQLLPRMDYFDFMKLLDHAQFVITDGGSNQEELFYMGKPCLIMRKTTERGEGLGLNAIMYGGNILEIENFAGKYEEFKAERIKREHSPSAIIADYLSNEAENSLSGKDEL